jgi:hypothetical protein
MCAYCQYENMSNLLCSLLSHDHETDNNGEASHTWNRKLKKIRTAFKY